MVSGSGQGEECGGELGEEEGEEEGREEGRGGGVCGVWQWKEERNVMVCKKEEKEGEGCVVVSKGE